MRAQVLKIVNLSIKYDHVVLSDTAHGLLAAREIDNAKPPVPEGSMIIDKEAFLIGTSICLRLRHSGTDAAGLAGQHLLWTKDSRYAAHGLVPFDPFRSF